MIHFDHVLSKSSSGYAIGAKMTYIDIALFHVLSATAAQFPEAWAKCHLHLLKEYVDRIAAFPPLKAYLQSERCRPWEGNSMM